MKPRSTNEHNLDSTFVALKLTWEHLGRGRLSLKFSLNGIGAPSTAPGNSEPPRSPTDKPEGQASTNVSQPLPGGGSSGRGGGQHGGPSAIAGETERELLMEAGASTTRFWETGTPSDPRELPGDAYQCWILYRRRGGGDWAVEEEEGPPPERLSVIHTGW